MSPNIKHIWKNEARNTTQASEGTPRLRVLELSHLYEPSAGAICYETHHHQPFHRDYAPHTHTLTWCLKHLTLYSIHYTQFVCFYYCSYSELHIKDMKSSYWNAGVGEWPSQALQESGRKYQREWSDTAVISWPLWLWTIIKWLQWGVRSSG